MGHTAPQRISAPLGSFETCHPALQGMHWLVLVHYLEETHLRLSKSIIDTTYKL